MSLIKPYAAEAALNVSRFMSLIFFNLPLPNTSRILSSPMQCTLLYPMHHFCHLTLEWPRVNLKQTFLVKAVSLNTKVTVNPSDLCSYSSVLSKNSKICVIPYLVCPISISEEDLVSALANCQRNYIDFLWPKTAFKKSIFSNAIEEYTI